MSENKQIEQEAQSFLLANMGDLGQMTKVESVKFAYKAARQKDAERIAELESELKKEREVVDWYADEDNWTISKDHSAELNENNINATTAAYTRIWEDSDGTVSLGDIVSLVAGKRARQRQKERK